MILGEAFSKLETVCMDFEPYFKVHNLVSVYPKSIIHAGQMTNLNMIVHVVVSVYRLVKIWNSPQFPDEFRNGQLNLCPATAGDPNSPSNCWFSHDVTKFQTSELLILLRSYFHDV